MRISSILLLFSGGTDDGEVDLESSHPDPFVRSMALWELKRYGDALDTLLSPAGRLHATRENAQKQDNEPTPSVFNFYVYLRTHPRLKRHNLPSQVILCLINILVIKSDDLPYALKIFQRFLFNNIILVCT